MRALAPWAAAARPSSAAVCRHGPRGTAHRRALCSCSCSGKRGENEEEEKIEADMRIPLLYIQNREINGETVGVNKKFNLLIEWRVGQINIWRNRFRDTVGYALRPFTVLQPGALLHAST